MDDYFVGLFKKKTSGRVYFTRFDKKQCVMFLFEWVHDDAFPSESDMEAIIEEPSNHEHSDCFVIGTSSENWSLKDIHYHFVVAAEQRGDYYEYFK